MDTNSSSEDEVFFGPVTAKEKRVASRYHGRKTLILPQRNPLYRRWSTTHIPNAAVTTEDEITLASAVSTTGTSDSSSQDCRPQESSQPPSRADQSLLLSLDLSCNENSKFSKESSKSSFDASQQQNSTINVTSSSCYSSTGNFGDDEGSISSKKLSNGSSPLYPKPVGAAQNSTINMTNSSCCSSTGNVGDDEGSISSMKLSNGSSPLYPKPVGAAQNSTINMTNSSCYSSTGNFGDDEGSISSKKLSNGSSPLYPKPVGAAQWQEPYVVSSSSHHFSASPKLPTSKNTVTALHQHSPTPTVAEESDQLEKISAHLQNQCSPQSPGLTTELVQNSDISAFSALTDSKASTTCPKELCIRFMDLSVRNRETNCLPRESNCDLKDSDVCSMEPDCCLRKHSVSQNELSYSPRHPSQRDSKPGCNLTESCCYPRESLIHPGKQECSELSSNPEESLSRLSKSPFVSRESNYRVIQSSQNSREQNCKDFEPDLIVYESPNIYTESNGTKYDSVRFVEESNSRVSASCSISREPSCTDSEFFNIPRKHDDRVSESLNVSRDLSCNVCVTHGPNESDSLVCECHNSPEEPDCADSESFNAHKEPESMISESPNISGEPEDTVSESPNISGEPDDTVSESPNISGEPEDTVSESPNISGEPDDTVSESVDISRELDDTVSESVDISRELDDTFIEFPSISSKPDCSISECSSIARESGCSPVVLEKISRESDQDSNESLRNCRELGFSFTEEHSNVDNSYDTPIELVNRELDCSNAIKEANSFSKLDYSPQEMNASATLPASPRFNDTLEEIELFMKYGINYGEEGNSSSERTKEHITSPARCLGDPECNPGLPCIVIEPSCEHGVHSNSPKKPSNNPIESPSILRGPNLSSSELDHKLSGADKNIRSMNSDGEVSCNAIAPLTVLERPDDHGKLKASTSPKFNDTLDEGDQFLRYGVNYGEKGSSSCQSQACITTPAHSSCSNNLEPTQESHQILDASAKGVHVADKKSPVAVPGTKALHGTSLCSSSNVNTLHAGIVHSLPALATSATKLRLPRQVQQVTPVSRAPPNLPRSQPIREGRGSAMKTTPTLKLAKSSSSSHTPTTSRVKQSQASRMRLNLGSPTAAPIPRATGLPPHPQKRVVRPFLPKKNQSLTPGEHNRRVLWHSNVKSPLAKELRNNPPPPSITNVKPSSSCSPGRWQAPPSHTCQPSPQLQPTSSCSFSKGSKVLKVDAEGTSISQMSLGGDDDQILPVTSYKSGEAVVLEHKNNKENMSRPCCKAPVRETNVIKHTGRLKVAKPQSVFQSRQSERTSMMEVSIHQHVSRD